MRVMGDRTLGPWLTAAGIVPDILQNVRHHLQRDPLIYLPFAEQPERQVFLVARTRVPPTTLTNAFRSEVQHLDENFALDDVRSLVGTAERPGPRSRSIETKRSSE